MSSVRRSFPSPDTTGGIASPRWTASSGQAIASLRALLAENQGLRAGVDPGNLWHQGASVSSPRTPAEVAAQTFELARSGSAYRMREVDELLDEVIHLLTRLEAENELLRARSTLQ